MAKKSKPKKKRSDLNLFLAYFVTGVGAGILITNPLANPHPVRWGLLLIGLGLGSYFLATLES